MHMCTIFETGEDERQERAWDPLELQLQMAVSYQVGLGREPGPAEEQPVLLIAEPPLQPLLYI